MNKFALLLRLAILFLSTIVFRFSVEAIDGNHRDAPFDQPHSFTDKHMKILLLISSSDDQPIYPECEKIWRAYMHLDPDHVEAYFFKSNPELEVPCKIEGDIIRAQAETSGFPGGMQKTLRSMELMLPRIHEFDYVVRITVSSFIYFPRLFDFLESLPKIGCCSAVKGLDIIEFPSGAGIIFSPDVVELLVDNKKQLWDLRTYDDVLLGWFLAENKIPIIPATRCDLLSVDSWFHLKDNIPDHIFHFRVKTPNPNLRVTEDIYILKELLKRYYDIPL